MTAGKAKTWRISCVLFKNQWVEGEAKVFFGFFLSTDETQQ